jgi:hypothetical protein
MTPLSTPRHSRCSRPSSALERLGAPRGELHRCPCVMTKRLGAPRGELHRCPCVMTNCWQLGDNLEKCCLTHRHRRPLPGRCWLQNRARSGWQAARNRAAGRAPCGPFGCASGGCAPGAPGGCASDGCAPGAPGGCASDGCPAGVPSGGCASGACAPGGCAAGACVPGGCAPGAGAAEGGVSDCCPLDDCASAPELAKGNITARTKASLIMLTSLLGRPTHFWDSEPSTQQPEFGSFCKCQVA